MLYTPKTQPERTGFHIIKTTFIPQCNECPVQRLCDATMQNDAITIIRGSNLCTTILANGNIHKID